jgi:predicted ATPase
MELVGRERELNRLGELLNDALAGKGSAVMLSGEAGIGKTRLVEEFLEHVGTREARVLSGSAETMAQHPFLIFSKALGGVTARPLFEEQDTVSFTEIFAVTSSGLLMAKASSDEGLDADIFTGMLTAVQDFVQDSFDSSGQLKAGLGRLEYGDLTILIEHSSSFYLTAVFKGGEHADMKLALRRTLKEIEETQGDVLASWSGFEDDIAPTQALIARLARQKFVVRRSLEGVELTRERVRIADDVLALVRELASAGPLVLHLEDLHWADESSLFVLRYLARNIRDHRVMLLCTNRPDQSEILETVLGGMREEGTCTEIALKPLGAEDVSGLVELVYPDNDFPSSLVDNLSGQCEGNPFFVIEMLHQMGEEGNIVETDDRFVLVNEVYSVPSSVESIVQRRLSSLSVDAMALAEYSSCIGKEFDRDVSRSLSSVSDIPGAFRSLETAGILSFSNGTARFTHSLFQDVTYESISPHWRSLYHKSIGEYYESAYADDLDAVQYELARHFSRSKEFEKAFEHCIKAAEKAESAYAPEQAAAFYTDAREAMPKDVSDEQAVALHERLGDAQKLYGDLDSALENFQRAMSISQENTVQARMLRNVSKIYENKGEMDTSLEYLAKAKDTAGGGLEYGRSLVAEGFVYMRKGENPKALPLLHEALEIFENEGEKQDIGRALGALGGVHMNDQSFTEAVEYYEKSLAVAEEINDLEGISAALCNSGLVYREWSQLDTALEKYLRSLEIDEKIGDIRGQAGMCNNIGVVYHDKAEFDKALEYLNRSLRIVENMGDTWGQGLLTNNIAQVHYDQGDLDTALSLLNRSLEMREKVGDKRSISSTLNNLAFLHLYRNEMDQAHDMATRGLALANETNVPTRIGCSQRAMGAVQRELGNHKESETLLNESRTKFDPQHERVEIARTDLERAKLMKAMGRGEESQALIEKVKALAKELGNSMMEIECERVECT